MRARIEDVAREAGLSEGYLEQLFLQLKDGWLIIGMPGAGGGYLLARPAAEISAGDVLRAVESSFRLTDCLEGERCEREGFCVSRLLWQGLQQEIDAVVDGLSLADLARQYTSGPEHTLDFSI